MKKVLLIILFIINSCGSDPVIKDVFLNHSVKVFSQQYHDDAENYIFKWKPIKGPANSKSIFKWGENNDMLIFEPKKLGIYEIGLTIEDISNETIAEEIFYFNVIPETTVVLIANDKTSKSGTTLIIKDSTNSKINLLSKASKDTTYTSKIKQKYFNKINKKKENTFSNNKTKKNNLNAKTNNPIKVNKTIIDQKVYVVQISSWPTIEEARTAKLELISEGFDAYIQKIYLDKNDQIWYRVRVGNFKKRNVAIRTKQKIEKITGLKTWLDIVSRK